MEAFEPAHYQRAITMVRAQLDGATFNAAWHVGRQMTIEVATDFALCGIDL